MIVTKYTPGTRARIHKGVKPYGGRIFPAYTLREYPNGRRAVEVYVGVAGFPGHDTREYDPAKVDIIAPRLSAVSK